MAICRGKPVAPNSENTVTLTTIALGTLSVSPLDPSDLDRPFGIELTPTRDAYVVVLQRTFGGEPADGVPLRPRIGRTNVHGWVLERDEGDIHDGPAPSGPACETRAFTPGPNDPPAPECRDRLLVDPSEQFDLYWCVGRDNFERLYEAATHGHAPEDLERFALAFRPSGTSARLRGLPGLSDELRRKAAWHLSDDCLGSPWAGLVPARDVAVFDVTPAPLRAMYKCEFLHWYQVTAVKRAAPQLACLSRARELIRAANKGLPDIGLDARFSAQPGTPERYVLDHYRDYVWQCAANGIDWDEVSLAIDVPLNSLYTEADVRGSRWYPKAEELRRRTSGAAEHPVFRAIPRSKLVLDWSQQDIFRDYHDVYLFGARLRKRKLDQRFGNALHDLEEKVSGTRRRIAEELSSSAPHAAFMIALDVGTESDPVARALLIERYCRVAADASHAWWSSLDGYTRDDWNKLKGRIKWIAAGPDGFAKCFKHFFESELKAYELGLEAARGALTTLTRYQLVSVNKMPADVFESSLGHWRTKVRVDLRAQTVTLLDGSGGGARVDQPLELFFTRQVPALDAGGVDRPASNMDAARRVESGQNLRRGQVVELEVVAPLDMERLRGLGVALPDFMIEAIGAVNSAVGIRAALEQLRQRPSLELQNLEAWFELGKNALSSMESVAELQSALWPKRHGEKRLLARLAGSLKGISKAVALPDAAFSLAEGIKTLMSDDGPLAYELRQGRRARAGILELKSVIQIASSVAGAALTVDSLLVLGGASAAGVLTAVTGPVGIMIVCGSVLVAALDAELDMNAPYAQHTARLEAAFDGALRTLFADAQHPDLLVAEQIARMAREV